MDDEEVVELQGAVTGQSPTGGSSLTRVWVVIIVLTIILLGIGLAGLALGIIGSRPVHIPPPPPFINTTNTSGVFFNLTVNGDLILPGTADPGILWTGVGGLVESTALGTGQFPYSADGAGGVSGISRTQAVP